ncbi:MAG: chorismate mutase [Firmicutes bacterium]|nr:chorismate mutase [Bacillota bacterium]
MQAIRGAITVDQNDSSEILKQTQVLLETILEANKLAPDEIISIIFTATPDLNAAFPATAARAMGLEQVALLDAVEIDVPGALPRVIRLLMFVDRPHAAAEVRHIYLGGAKALRPDLSPQDA